MSKVQGEAINVQAVFINSLKRWPIKFNVIVYFKAAGGTIPPPTILLLSFNFDTEFRSFVVMAFQIIIDQLKFL